MCLGPQSPWLAQLKQSNVPARTAALLEKRLFSTRKALFPVPPALSFLQHIIMAPAYRGPHTVDSDNRIEARCAAFLKGVPSIFFEKTEEEWGEIKKEILGH